MSLRTCPKLIFCSFAVTVLTAASFGSARGADPLVPGAADETSEDIRLVAAAITADDSDKLTLEVDEAIKITSRRFLTANVHTPWQILHGILALRQDFQIKLEDQKTSALKWLSEGNEWKGESIVVKTPHGGEFHRFTKPYHFQGHPNQFLAILTMSELSTDYEMLTSKGETVTIEQMLDNAKMTVNDREEITWTLWALARYLPIDSEWINQDGDPWSMERLVQIQTYADLSHAACGGTHGLFALSLARNSYIYSGRKPRGIWIEADQKIKRYIAEARSLQNTDGTFSSNYFSGPGRSEDFGKRLATSGHILEFLMVAVDDDELKKPWLRKAVRAVALELTTNRRKAADCGPLYHALHALVLYRQRTSEADVSSEAVEPEKARPQLPEINPEEVPTPVKQEQPESTRPRPAVETETGESVAPATPVEAALSTDSEEAAPADSASQETSTLETPATETVKPLFDGSLPDRNLTSIDSSSEPSLLGPKVAEVEQSDGAAGSTGSTDPFAVSDPVKATPQNEVIEQTEDPPSDRDALEENARNSMGMSGVQPESVDVPLPPTSD